MRVEVELSRLGAVGLGTGAARGPAAAVAALFAAFAFTLIVGWRYDSSADARARAVDAAARLSEEDEQATPLSSPTTVRTRSTRQSAQESTPDSQRQEDDEEDDEDEGKRRSEGAAADAAGVSSGCLLTDAARELDAGGDEAGAAAASGWTQFTA
eukprot:gene45609-49688_t